MPSAAVNGGLLGVASSGFNPATFNPFVWMDTRNGITDDGSGRVNPWVDQSANAYSFSQSTASNRFGYSASNASFNNKPTASPNGSADNYLKTSGITAFGPTFSLFIYGLVNTPQSGATIGGWLTGAVQRQMVLSLAAGVLTATFDENATVDALLTLTDTINQVRSICITYDSSIGQGKLYRKQGNNATTSATRTITAGARPAGTFDRIIWGNSAGSLLGTLCQMIGVPSVLSQANFESFHDWAKAIYG